MRDTWVRSLGWEDPLEKGIATYSIILVWIIPWTKKPGGLQSMWSQVYGWASFTFTFFVNIHWRSTDNLCYSLPTRIKKKKKQTPSFASWKLQTSGEENHKRKIITLNHEESLLEKEDWEENQELPNLYLKVKTGFSG